MSSISERIDFENQEKNLNISLSFFVFFGVKFVFSCHFRVHGGRSFHFPPQNRRGKRKNKEKKRKRRNRNEEYHKKNTYRCEKILPMECRLCALFFSLIFASLRNLRKKSSRERERERERERKDRRRRMKVAKERKNRRSEAAGHLVLENGDEESEEAQEDEEGGGGGVGGGGGGRRSWTTRRSSRWRPTHCRLSGGRSDGHHRPPLSLFSPVMVENSVTGSLTVADQVPIQFGNVPHSFLLVETSQHSLTFP